MVGVLKLKQFVVHGEERITPCWVKHSSVITNETRRPGELEEQLTSLKHQIQMLQQRLPPPANNGGNTQQNPPRGGFRFVSQQQQQQQQPPPQSPCGQWVFSRNVAAGPGGDYLQDQHPAAARPKTPLPPVHHQPLLVFSLPKRHTTQPVCTQTPPLPNFLATPQIRHLSSDRVPYQERLHQERLQQERLHQTPLKRLASPSNTLLTNRYYPSCTGMDGISSVNAGFHPALKNPKFNNHPTSSSLLSPVRLEYSSVASSPGVIAEIQTPKNVDLFQSPIKQPERGVVVVVDQRKQPGPLQYLSTEDLVGSQSLNTGVVSRQSMKEATSMAAATPPPNKDVDRKLNRRKRNKSKTNNNNNNRLSITPTMEFVHIEPDNNWDGRASSAKSGGFLVASRPCLLFVSHDSLVEEEVVAEQEDDDDDDDSNKFAGTTAVCPLPINELSFFQQSGGVPSLSNQDDAPPTQKEDAPNDVVVEAPLHTASNQPPSSPHLLLPEGVISPAHVVQLDVDDTLIPTSQFCEEGWLDKSLAELPESFQRKLELLDLLLTRLFTLLHHMVVYEDIEEEHPSSSSSPPPSPENEDETLPLEKSWPIVKSLPLTPRGVAKSPRRPCESKNYLLSVIIITNATMSHIRSVFERFLPNLMMFLQSNHIQLDELICSARDLWCEEFPFEQFYDFWKCWTLEDILGQLRQDGVKKITVLSIGDDEPERRAAAYVRQEIPDVVSGIKLIKMVSHPDVVDLAVQLEFIMENMRSYIKRNTQLDIQLSLAYPRREIVQQNHPSKDHTNDFNGANCHDGGDDDDGDRNHGPQQQCSPATYRELVQFIQDRNDGNNLNVHNSSDYVVESIQSLPLEPPSPFEAALIQFELKFETFYNLFAVHFAEPASFSLEDNKLKYPEELGKFLLEQLEKAPEGDLLSLEKDCDMFTAQLHEDFSALENAMSQLEPAAAAAKEEEEEGNKLLPATTMLLPLINNITKFLLIYPSMYQEFTKPVHQVLTAVVIQATSDVIKEKFSS